MPPPAHMVMSATCSSRRSSSSSAVPTSSEPVAPIGWPSAMAPPLTLILLAVDVEVADELLRDDGEGLVDLEQVDVAQRHARLGEHLAGGRDGRVQHQRGVVADVRRRHDPGPRPQAVCRGVLGARDEQGGGAVDHARRVARRGARASISRPGNFCRTRERYVVPLSSSGMSARASNDEGREASESAVVPGRGYSSRSRATVPSRLCTGTVERSNRPSLMATSARRCDSAASSSTARRSIFSSVAMASAATPWFVWGWMARR